MPRFDLLARLTTYTPWDDIERDMARRTLTFATNDPRCMDAANPPGHITGSAWVLDPDGGHVLLTLHRKLNRWLQLGGHIDPGELVLAAALREAEEESGLGGIRPVHTAIFDIDVHTIPARGDKPEHLHYDVRFLLACDRRPPKPSSESREVAWVALGEVAVLNPQESMQRMVRKTEARKHVQQAV